MTDEGAVRASGDVIARPQPRHTCEPGWRDEFLASRDALGFGPGWYGIPPSPSDFPKGTVWKCSCGRTWVSRGALAPNVPGYVCDWRREGWLARRRRERRMDRVTKEDE